MHELSITQNILSIAVEKAREAKADKITKINIIIGELSGIVNECVQTCFDFLSKDTIADGAGLCFERKPVQLRCRACDEVFSPGALDWACPSCQERKIEMISGRGCYIDSIEVE